MERQNWVVCEFWEMGGVVFFVFVNKWSRALGKLEREAASGLVRVVGPI